MIFRDLRLVLSRTNRLSICDRESESCWNFLSIEDVPEAYDRTTVVGIGTTAENFATGEPGVHLMSCLEIVITSDEVPVPW